MAGASPGFVLCETAYIVKAAMPGVKPEDVEVTLQNNVLTIQGEVKVDKAINEERYHLRERSYGSFLSTSPANPARCI
jgi:HSP20 family protein